MKSLGSCSFWMMIGLLVFATGCDKHHAKKLAGTYHCWVHYHYWDMSPKLVDSTYEEDIIVRRHGKIIHVLGSTIPIDSLRHENEYTEGYIHDYTRILFRNDSLYVVRSTGGMSGNASLEIAGSKR